MTKLEISDLTTDQELSSEALNAIRGGSGFLWNSFPWDRFVNFDFLSPDFFNQVTSINGTANVPTTQTNNLTQSDETIAINNGNGLNFVSNNKFATQSNSNWVGDFMNAKIK